MKILCQNVFCPEVSEFPSDNYPSSLGEKYEVVHINYNEWANVGLLPSSLQFRFIYFMAKMWWDFAKIHVAQKCLNISLEIPPTTKVVHFTCNELSKVVLLPCLSLSSNSASCLSAPTLTASQIQTWKNDSDCIVLSLVLQCACFSAMVYQMTIVWSCEGFFRQIYSAAPTIHMPLKHPWGIHLRSVHEIFL